MGSINKLNIIQYINQALGEGTYHNTSKGAQYSYRCPFCNDYKERLFISVHKQVFYCHNCEATGSLVTFISKYAHIPWYEALKVYRGYEGYDKQLPDSLEAEIYERLTDLPQIVGKKYIYPLPDEYIPIEKATGNAGKKAVSYLLKRGISLETARENRIGYCKEGRYANRIIMPDFEEGKLIFWQARTWLPPPKNSIKKKFYRKVLNPTLTEEQKKQGIIAVDKSEVISNIDTILSEGMAILCEGKFDALTIGDIAGCIHGKHMSDAQFMKLVTNKSKIDTIAIMLDPDAMRNAINLGKRLYKHFDDVLICKLPFGKDPNDIGKKGVLEALNRAIPYSPIFEVKARLKGWV